MRFYDYPCCEIKTLYTCAGCYAVLDYVNQEHDCPEKSDKVEYPVLCGIYDSDLDFPTKVQLRNKRKIKANLEWNETYHILLQSNLDILYQRLENCVDAPTINQTAAQMACGAADALCRLPRFRELCPSPRRHIDKGKSQRDRKEL